MKQMSHHEETATNQRTFLEKVQRLTSTLEEIGNPFQEETGDLLSSDTKDVAHPNTAERVATHVLIGNACFDAFLVVLETEDTGSLYAPIKKTKWTSFSRRNSRLSLKRKCWRRLPALVQVIHLLSKKGMWSAWVSATRVSHFQQFSAMVRGHMPARNCS